MPANQAFRDRIAEMCDQLGAMYSKDWAARDWRHAAPPTFTAEYGVKNVRIVTNDNTAHSRSVYCFVDVATGDIMKAEGWKKPAKDKRGSIWNENCDVGPDKPCNVFGSGLYAR